MLVSFEDVSESRIDPVQQTTDGQDDGDSALVRQLKAELEQARSQLHSTLDQMERSSLELKASNEEVMSINEELQTSNEEMETSHEELHSLNEELITLNSQLEDKVQELEETTNDLSNLLHSTEIATLFLDRRFHIRRYTPAINDLMRLIPADVGRVVTDITWHFDDPSLLEDAATVLAGKPVDQQEISGADQKWYLRRVAPYRTEGDRCEGVVITFTDITTRKSMEIALQQSESYLRRIADNLPALVSYIDSDLCYRFNNASYERWFDMSPDKVLGRRVPDVVGVEAFERLRPRMEAVLRGEAVAFEVWLPYAQGGSRYVSAQYIPDRNAQGAVQGFFALISDITEKRRIEEQLEKLNAENRRSLEEMRALLDAAPVGIFLGRDKACSDILMNRAGAEMLRIPANVNPSMNGPDADKLNFRVFRYGRELTPDELPMQLAASQACSIEGIEERVEFPDGSHVDLLTYAAPIFDADGNVQGCVGTFADVTRSRQMERMFRETSERLRAHIENTPLGIIEWDRETRITNWSGSAENVFGWSANEALGKTLKELGLIYEADEAHVTHVVTELLDGRKETNRCQNRNYRKDGSVIWCEWFNSVIRDSNGEILSALSVALDITERQRLEDALHERTRMLEEADRRKDVFLAMLGHELRNPLMPIRNVVHLLTMQGGGGVDIGWAAQVIERQTGHLQRMVDDLLDMARIRKGELNIEKSRIQLRPLVEEAISMLQPMVDEKHHHLSRKITQEALTVSGDATRLLQVFSNLISNAVRYTPDNGEIKVTLARVAGDKALIAVEDNGNGISSELLPNVFDIFNRAESHSERSNAGLGLGLSLVKQFVRLHQGEVNVESDGIGKGSRFSVTLPLVAEAANRQAADSTEDMTGETHSNELLNILLVDDNPDVRDSLKQLLSAFGHRVSVLDAGRKVADAVRDNPPDLVLLDLGMPDMDGYRVARELAGLAQRDRFKVVAVTGYAAEPEDGHEAHTDFDGYLLKPLTLDMLQPYLCKARSGSNTRR
ncbi:MAG: PAS domain S-box protein [Candidatus Thiodiazotropha sp.]